MTAELRPTDQGEKPADPNGADPLDQESLPSAQPDGTGLHEPSVLDYVKARLTPWRGPAPQIPAGGPGLAAGLVEAMGPDSPAAPAYHETDPESLERPAGLTLQALNRYLRPLTAFGLAVLGQRALEPPNRALSLGLVLYLLAVAVLAWSAWKGDWTLAPARDSQAASKTAGVRAYFFLFAVLFAVLAFLAFGGEVFNGLNLFFWIGSLVLLLMALWENPQPEVSWREKLISAANAFPLRLRISAWTMLLVGVFGISIFFRLYQLDQVPAEMISDHAEKLLDVADVLDGRWSTFFPRNTGREALQMFLTAGVAKVFGTGLSFLSLKIGTALAGLATLPFMYLLGVEVANRRTGLLTMALTGVAYWPNVITRIGLRFTLFPLFVAPTMYFLIRGLRRASRNDFVLAGLFLGLGLHGYSSFRIVPFLVILAVALFLVHRQSQGARSRAVWGLVVLAVVSLIVFLPLARYWVDHPEMYSYRAFTRLGSIEQPLPGPAWSIFLQNLWNATTMFFWSNGSIWVHSISNRPALDVISAAFFGMGLVSLLTRYGLKRHWLDSFLLLSIPVLMLPSILSLAFPAENPSLNRTSGALVPVFLIAGLGLDSLMSAIERGAVRRASALAWVVGALLFLWSTTQNFDLVFNQYARQYRLAAWNTSEIGHVVRGFADSVGDRDAAWVVGFPHWVDTRLVGINAGFPRKDYAIWPDILAGTLDVAGPKLFLLKPEDAGSVEALRALYPNGSLQTYVSKVETKDFLLYFVPSGG